MLKGQLLPAPLYPKGFPVWKVSPPSPHLHIPWTAFQPEQCEEAARTTPGRSKPARRCIPVLSADVPCRHHAQKKG